MPDFQELIDKARNLGEAIANHDTVKSYYTARQGVQDDREAQALLGEYTLHMQRMQQLEREQKPIEVADKQKVAEFESKISSNDLLKQLMRTQADYAALMNQVNQAMETPLAAAMTPKESV
ncbi:MAG: YlbF family regulator [Planctomycetota bacterium]